MSFYPHGQIPVNKGRSLSVSICPGQTKPYTLPQNIVRCPIEECPSSKPNRLFRPRWRLHEHMKTCHGWPHSDAETGKSCIESGESASITQQPVIRRGSTVSDKASTTGSSKRKFDDLDNSSHPPCSPSPPTLDGSFAEQSLSGRPKRDRRQTQKGKEMANSMAQLAAATSLRPSKKLRTSDESGKLSDGERSNRGQIPNGAEIPKGNGKFIQTRVPKSMDEAHGKSLTRDHDLIRAIRDLTKEMYAAAPTTPGLAKTAAEYESLISQDLVHVNCTFPTATAQTLLSCYQRVAERHNARANIFSMTPPPLPAARSPSSPIQRADLQSPRANRPTMDSAGETAPPSPPRQYQFVNDDPLVVSKRAAMNALGKSRLEGGTRRRSEKAPGSDAVAKPVMLKLRLNSSAKS